MSEGQRATLTRGGDCLVVHVPMKLKRRRGRKEIIAPAGMEWAVPEEPEANTNQGLAIMLARAHRWRDLLEEGRYASIGELARAVGVDNSYLARVLRLTLLAPDLVEAILEGEEADGLSLEKLYRAPMAWEEQRRGLMQQDG